MSSLRLGVRAAAWMASEFVPWQLLRALRSRDLDARISRAQAAFDAFEEEHETFPGEPDGLDWMLSWPPNTTSAAGAGAEPSPALSPQAGDNSPEGADLPPFPAPSGLSNDDLDAIPTSVVLRDAAYTINQLQLHGPYAKEFYRDWVNPMIGRLHHRADAFEAIENTP